MKKLIIIKAGTTFPATAEKYGDFDHWIRRCLAFDAKDLTVVDIVHGGALPEPGHCCGVIITGAHCMVTDNLPWSRALEEWIPRLIEDNIPLLGICYGHQLLARAMGGDVGFHPRGKELGTVEIKLLPASADDPLLSALPESFPVHVSHAQTVLTLPPGALRLAENSFEPNHAFRLGKQAWGVQFHPEYDTDIMHDYLAEQTASIGESGQTLYALQHKVRQTPEAGTILTTFARLCGAK